MSLWSYLVPEAKPAPVPEPEIDRARIPLDLTERRRCRHCGHLFHHGDESAMLRAGWCFGCETNWIEKRLTRLIDRIGHKATLAAFRRLTK